MLQSTANDIIQRIGAETRREIEALIAPAELAMNLVSHDTLGSAAHFDDRYQRVFAVPPTPTFLRNAETRVPTTLRAHA